MRYVIGFIVGVALTIGGAAIYDNIQPGKSSQLVNWENAGGLSQRTVGQVREQFDRLVKWATSS